MNEADFPSINLDELRLVPDWMREGGPDASKKYAGHDGPASDDRRPAGRGGPRRDGGGGFGRDQRAARPGGPRPGGPRPQGQGSGDRRENRGGPRPGGGGERRGHDFARPPRDETPPRPPAPVQVVFQPDEHCLASIVKQVRSTHLAYPLFALARMFLQEPARHWVQFTVEPAATATGTTLYQVGEEGPIALDRSLLEPLAFETARESLYQEETIQKEPLKGNFANVARERTTGTLLGPTNHHGYQPALRALYESRFSRRMSFEDFRRGVEIVSDPALIEKWKEEARTVMTISSRVGEGETPATFNTRAEARAHFRQHHLDKKLQTGAKRRAHGSVARNLPDPSLMQAIRHAHEQESRYPASFVQLLREGLQRAGLHIFKHRKRVVYVSLSRPTPFVPGHGEVSPTVAAILEFIGSNPQCTRKQIAEQVIGKVIAAPTPAEAPAAVEVAPAAAEEIPVPAEPSTPVEGAVKPLLAALAPTAVPEDSASKAKAALAADLRFLVQAGHIIEFHNGTFDLPLSPKAKEDAPGAEAKGESEVPDSGAVSEDVPVETAPADEPADEEVVTISETESPAVAEAPADAVIAADETIKDEKDVEAVEPHVVI